MRKELLLVGGFVLVAGGLAYWYLSQQQQNGGQGCSKYTTKTTCENAGCYWHSDNKCKSYPEGTTPCEDLSPTSCYDGKQGWRACDRYGNLCQCDNGTWKLVQEESTICANSISKWQCGLRSDGYVGCMKNYDYGPDECEPPPPIGWGFGQGCSCEVGQCDTRCWCEAYDKICVLKAPYTKDGGLVNALHNDMYCWDKGEGTTSYCQYWLPDGPWAASQITGTLFWKWGAWWPGEGVTYAIFGYYNGRINKLHEESHSFISGDTGKFTVQAQFPMQGIEALIFAIDGTISNIHIDYFVGNLI